MSNNLFTNFLSQLKKQIYDMKETGLDTVADITDTDVFLVLFSKKRAFSFDSNKMIQKQLLQLREK